MSKLRRSYYGIVKCPNGCGKTFKLNFKDEPKGMAEHLESCGEFSFFDGLKITKEGVGDGISNE